MLFPSGVLTTPLLVPLDRITSSASTTPIILLLFIITIPRAAQVSKQNNNNRKSFFLQMSARQERWIIRWVTCNTTGEQMIDSAVKIVFPCYSTVNQLISCRKDCIDPIKNVCKEKYGTLVERDTTVWKWKETVVEKMSDLSTEMGFLLSKNQRNMPTITFLSKH